MYAYRRKTKYSDKWTQIGEIITPKEELNTLSFFGASLDLSDDGKVMDTPYFYMRWGLDMDRDTLLHLTKTFYMT